MRYHALTLMASLLVIAAPAMAARKPSFNQAERDGDHKVSIQEAVKAGVPEDEARSNDPDNDGQLARIDWKFVDMKPSGDKSSDSSGSSD